MIHSMYHSSNKLKQIWSTALANPGGETGYSYDYEKTLQVLQSGFDDNAYEVFYLTIQV